MCGIAGIASFNSEHLEAEKTLNKMLCAMAHRGNDGRGTFKGDGGHVLLGHLRLAIIDLSVSANQPMQSLDGRYSITFNGEIYNYKELAKELGCPDDVGDTYVLIVAFTRWGKDCLPRLRGMFAFAIWDNQEQSLFCARDHIGIKPFYWWSSDNKTFVFASEIKGMLASGFVPRVADADSIADYLQFYCVHPPKTILQDVFALLPGHYLTFNSSGELETEQWWDCSMVPVNNDLLYEESVELVREKFLESVEFHLRADVPVGLFLSGGIDSSALAGAMAAFGNVKDLHTFSVGFECDSDLDESDLAGRIAQKIGTQHHRIELSSQSLGECFYDFIKAIDQPSGDGLNSFFVSCAASQNVKVAFSGLGADELFLGYNYMREFKRMINLSNICRIPLFLENFARSSFGKKVLYKLGLSFVQRQRGGYEAVYKGYRSLRSPEEVEQMLDRAFCNDFDLKKHFINNDPMNGLSLAELEFYASPMLLRDTDAVSMHHTLEVRVPFFDPELIKTVLSIPGKFKGNGKKLFVDAVRDFIPKDVIGRPKQGFEMPVATWIFEELCGELGEMEKIDWLSKKGIKDSINPAFEDYYLPMWSIMVLQQWLKRWDVEVPYE